MQKNKKIKKSHCDLLVAPYNSKENNLPIYKKNDIETK